MFHNVPNKSTSLRMRALVRARSAVITPIYTEGVTKEEKSTNPTRNRRQVFLRPFMDELRERTTYYKNLWGCRGKQAS